MLARLRILLALAALALLGLAASVAVAESGSAAAPPAGSMDQSFGVGGFSSAGLPSEATSMAVQSDGKILVAGPVTAGGQRFGVARLLPTGVYDPSFGGGWQNVAPLSPGDAWSVLLQSDGKILLVGETFSGGGAAQCAAARLNPNGTLDPSFGTGGVGIYRYPAAVGASCDAAALAPGGRIVIGGSSQFGFVLARLTSSGALDTSFGSGGWTSGGSPTRADRVLVQPDGKIVLGGPTPPTETETVARVTATGVYDPSFGSGGRVALTELTSILVHPAGLALQPDGEVVVAGSDGGDFAAIRLDAGGAVNRHFVPPVGEATVDLGANDVASAVAVQPDGKIVLAGYSDGPLGLRIATARLTSLGLPDPTFGFGGKAVLLFNGRAEADAIALQQDGKVVVAGDQQGPPLNFLVARVLGDPQPAAATTTTAKPTTTVAKTTTTTPKPATTTIATTTTVAVTTTAESKRPKSPLAARIVYTAVTGKGAKRQLVLRIRVSEQVRAELRLLKNGTPVLDKAAILKPGGNTITSHIPPTLGNGTCLLKVALTDSHGNHANPLATVLVRP